MGTAAGVLLALWLAVRDMRQRRRDELGRWMWVRLELMRPVDEWRADVLELYREAMRGANGAELLWCSRRMMKDERENVLDPPLAMGPLLQHLGELGQAGGHLSQAIWVAKKARGVMDSIEMACRASDNSEAAAQLPQLVVRLRVLHDYIQRGHTALEAPLREQHRVTGLAARMRSAIRRVRFKPRRG